MGRKAKYSKELKIDTAKRYLNGEGFYPQLAIRFNISTDSIIIGWVKRYNSHIELNDYIPGGDIYMTKSRKVNKAERLEIVKYCMKHNLDYKTSAKIYEVSYANVYNWVKKYKEHGEHGLGDKRGVHKSDEEVDEVELLKRQLEKYQHQLEISQLEVRLLKKAEEIEKGNPSNISLLCSILKVKRANYYKWLHHKKSARDLENEELAMYIKRYDEMFNHTLGYRMMTDRINRDENKHYNDKQVYKIMKVLGIQSHIRRKVHSCTIRKKNNTTANLLKRNFNASKPNEKRVGDVTEFKYGNP